MKVEDGHALLTSSDTIGRSMKLVVKVKLEGWSHSETFCASFARVQRDHSILSVINTSSWPQKRIHLPYGPTDSTDSSRLCALRFSLPLAFVFGCRSFGFWYSWSWSRGSCGMDPFGPIFHRLHLVQKYQLLPRHTDLGISKFIATSDFSLPGVLSRYHHYCQHQIIPVSRPVFKGNTDESVWCRRRYLIQERFWWTIHYHSWIKIGTYTASSCRTDVVEKKSKSKKSPKARQSLALTHLSEMSVEGHRVQCTCQTSVV